MQTVPEAGDDHTAFGSRVVLADRESLPREIWHHQHRRLETQTLLDHSTRVCHFFHGIHRHGRLDVIVAYRVLLLTHLAQDLRMVSEVLEQVRQTARHGILRREQETQQHHTDFAVRKVTHQDTALLGSQVFVVAVLTRIDHGADPRVSQARHLLAQRHALLALGGRVLEPLHGILSCLNSAVYLGAGKGKGEVDKLERHRDEPVLVRDLLGALLRDIAATKHAQGRLKV